MVIEAQRIERLKALRGSIVKKDNYSHLIDQVGKKGKMIIDKIQRAVNELRVLKEVSNEK